jgi:hypothetical protein
LLLPFCLWPARQPRLFAVRLRMFQDGVYHVGTLCLPFAHIISADPGTHQATLHGHMLLT